MPNAQHNPVISARRFAALLAGFDTGNGSEEEALAKARVLRRMAADAGMRIVDVMELPEVKRAIDDQMRPARTESPALQEALERSLALQTELTERTRDVSQLAERLHQQEERTKELSRELAASRATRPAWAPARTGWASSPAGRAAAWFLDVDQGMALLMALLALALLIAAIGGGHFYEGGNGNGLGYSARISSRGLDEGRAVRSLSNHRAVHHRVRRGRASHRSRSLRGVPVPHVHVPLRRAYGGEGH